MHYFKVFYLHEHAFAQVFEIKCLVSTFGLALPQAMLNPGRNLICRCPEVDWHFVSKRQKRSVVLMSEN